MKSPCLDCTRVKYPKNCENKTCKDWQAWFIDRWESMRAYVQAQMDQKKETDIPFGQLQYAVSHCAQEYLKEDPCNGCPCPKDTCHTPCPVKSAWLEKEAMR